MQEPLLVLMQVQTRVSTVASMRVPLALMPVLAPLTLAQFGM